MNLIKTPIGGMRDFSPADVKKRDYILSVIEQVAYSYGYQKIETPAMEHLENLTSKEGGENEELIFKILKRGQSLEDAEKSGDNLSDSALRYDLTVPLARYFSNNKGYLPLPFKVLQIGPVWRADRPQKGRFRQFIQCDVDIIGDNSILAEIDVISTIVEMINKLFSKISTPSITVHINDRRILTSTALFAGFDEKDVSTVLIELDKTEKIGLSKVKDNLINLGFDSEKVGAFINLFENVKEGIKIKDFCSQLDKNIPEENVVQDLENIIEIISETSKEKCQIMFDPTLVRGMGYYTGPIFECKLSNYSSSIAGGGRYDKMIGKFDGSGDVSACGFSIGFERISEILDDAGFAPKSTQRMTAILVDKDVPQEQLIEITTRAKELRHDGSIVSILPMNKNLGYQIKMLEESGYSSIEKIYRDK